MNTQRPKTVMAVALAALILSFTGQARAAEHEHAKHFTDCAKACAACQIECDSCFKHCLALLTDGKKDHAKTVQSCVDCAECCQACASLCARQSPYSAHMLEGCAKCCDDCAAACEKFPDDKHMAACAKSCRDCAKSCREMLKHLKP